MQFDHTMNNDIQHRLGLDPDDLRPLCRPKKRWMDHIKEDIKCMGNWASPLKMPW
ncbi:hypothetical protein L345_14851, partial [Ophiophagus hannah]